MSFAWLTRLLSVTLFTLSVGVSLQAAAFAAPVQSHRRPLPAGAHRGLLNSTTPLRTAPSATAPAIRKVLRDLSVAVYGTQNGCCAIELRNGTQGWVASSAIRLATPLPGNCF